MGRYPHTKSSRRHARLSKPYYDELLSGLASECAVTRTVRDAAAVLDAVNGPGIGDTYEIAPPTRPYTQEGGMPPERLRLALTTRAWSGVPVEHEQVQAVEVIGRELVSLGHTVEDASPSLDWETFIASHLPFWMAFLAESAVGLTTVLGVELGPDVLEAVTLSSVEYGHRLTALDLSAAQRLCKRISRSVRAFFSNDDVLVTPTVAQLPPPLGYLNQHDPPLDPRGWLDKVFAVVPFTPLFNVTGHPAMSLPLAQSSAGLPIGIQWIARSGDEATLFRLAAQLEQAFPWDSRRPHVVAARSLPDVHLYRTARS